MNIFHLLHFCIVIVICAGCAQKTSNLQLVEENLFEHLEVNAQVTSENVWTVDDDGVIVGDGGQSYLSTLKEYDDFVLELDFYPDAEINSGVFIRCPGPSGSAVDCYEVNIWDDHVNQEYRTGAIVRHGQPLTNLNSVGKWNTYKIKAQGDHIQVWMNGEKTADLKDSKTTRGFIVLQVFDQGTIKFKNVKVTAL